MKKILIAFGAASLLLQLSCSKDDAEVAVYDDTPYALDYGTLAAPEIAADNQLTNEGVKLGKMLFYETKMSKDLSMSCASCHRQEHAFTDTTKFSIGVEGLPGGRQAMTIFNMGLHSNEFFWDGRAHLLRDQSLLPIQDPLEMNETLENVIEKLSAEKMYTDQFIRAFGDDNITEERLSLALEQFMNSIVSNNSKHDQYLAGSATLSESEERGRQLFFAEYNPFFPDESGADCAHCHGGSNFENDAYMNNGLDAAGQFADLGREDVTMDEMDRAKFKVTSLRNIGKSAPYMHDGRFATLEEVVDHYNEMIKESPSLDPALRNTMETGLMLTEQDKTDLVNFLKTLDDETFLTNPEYASPF